MREPTFAEVVQVGFDGQQIETIKSAWDYIKIFSEEEQKQISVGNLGIDSLDLFDVTMNLGEHFRFHFEDGLITWSMTLAELHQAVLESLQE